MQSGSCDSTDRLGTCEPSSLTGSRVLKIVLFLVALTFACSPASDPDDLANQEVVGRETAPATENGPLAPQVVADLDALVASWPSDVEGSRAIDIDAVGRLGQADDVRVAWVLVDLLRFLSELDPAAFAIRDALVMLTGVSFDRPWWVNATNQLLEWDTPAPPGYVGWKRVPFDEALEPVWAAFFDDTNASFDYRYVSWGGVLADDRSVAEAEAGVFCACIPALSQPAVTDAAEGGWYPDDAVVFGIVVNGMARAYPKNILEVHELVNDRLGGRAVGPRVGQPPKWSHPLSSQCFAQNSCKYLSGQF